MPLGSNYNYNAGLGDYRNAIQDYYERKKRQNLLSTLLGIGGMGAMFIPGLSPLAMAGIGEGTNLLQSGVTGTPYSPDFGNIAKTILLPKLLQQKRMGDVVGAGEGTLMPEDINKFGQQYPDWMDWNSIGGGESIGGAGPMSLSKGAVKSMGDVPVQVTSPAVRNMQGIKSQEQMMDFMTKQNTFKRDQIKQEILDTEINTNTTGELSQASQLKAKAYGIPIDEINNDIEFYRTDPTGYAEYKSIGRQPHEPAAWEVEMGTVGKDNYWMDKGYQKNPTTGKWELAPKTGAEPKPARNATQIIQDISEVKDPYTMKTRATTFEEKYRNLDPLMVTIPNQIDTVAQAFKIPTPPTKDAIVRGIVNGDYGATVAEVKANLNDFANAIKAEKGITYDPAVLDWIIKQAQSQGWKGK